VQCPESNHCRPKQEQASRQRPEETQERCN